MRRVWIPLIVAGGCGKVSDPSSIPNPRLTLSSSSVEDGDVDVPVDVAIELTFEADVDPDEDGAHVVLEDRRGAVPVRVSVDGNVLTVVPEELLEHMETSYVLRLSEDLPAEDGRTLGEEVSLSFRTVLFTPGQPYVIRPLSFPVRVLAVPGGGACELQIPLARTVAEQRFTVEVAGLQRYRFKPVSRPGDSLEGGGEGGNCYAAEEGPYTGQFWRLEDPTERFDQVPDDAEGRYRVLGTDFQWPLVFTAALNQTSMDPLSEAGRGVTDQLWTFERAD